jgi:DNA-directed RNA polymerase subunit RPC12/RpoP
MRVKPLIAAGIALTIIGWIALMVSFWLPGVIGHALQATALSVGIPGLVFAIVPAVFGQEIEEFQPTKKPQSLRCTDCGSKILNAGGTTIGDQIEGELMVGPWTPPSASPFDRKGK